MDHLYSLYDALVSINVPNDKARAVVDAMESDMDRLATKSEIKAEFQLVRQEMTSMGALLSKDMQSLKHDMEHRLATLTKDMTLRLGTLVSAGLVAVYALQRFL